MQLPSHFVTLKNIQEARTALNRTGCLLIEDGVDAGGCQDVVRWIDAFNEADGEINYGGTELRIWDAQKRLELLAEFTDQCNVFLSCVLGSESEAHTLLAIRNRSVKKGDANLQLGRWHIDSFRHQYKIFLFLADVDEARGPFEFIPGTQATSFKARMFASGVYFRPADLLSGSRSYSRLEDSWVERIAGSGYRPQPVLCRAGTVMIVNTSSVHRARPCHSGTRYALTAYYR